MQLSIDPEFDVHGQEAGQRCSLLMYNRDPARRTSTCLTTGRYLDEFVRTEAGGPFAIGSGSVYAHRGEIGVEDGG